MNLTELHQAVKDAREKVWGRAVADRWPTALTHYAALAGLERAIREVEGVRCEYATDCRAIGRGRMFWCRRCITLTALYAEAEKLMEVKA